jgi:hypothetical protein
MTKPKTMTRRELEDYRTEIEAAYQQVQKALANLGSVIGRMVPQAPARRTTLTKREICKQIMEERGALDIYQIIQEMRSRGFAFTGKNHINTVRSFLYSCEEFTCEKGIFRLRR